MEDDDAAPTQFKVENDEIQPEIANIPNLWFVLSPYEVKQRNFNLEFCPLCQGRHRVFYCCDCIVKGEFMHSNPRQTGDLAEKRLQMEIVESRRSNLSLKIGEKLKSTTKMKFLQEEIKLTKQRIKCLNHIIKDKKESVSKSVENTTKLKEENLKRTLRLPKFGSKVDKIDQYAKQHIFGLEQQRLKVNQNFKKLIQKRRLHIKELTKLIFPIELIEVENSQNLEKIQDENFDSIMAEMEDAMSTSYIHGRWVTTSFNDGATAINLEGDKNWKIVAPNLPANDSLLYSFVASSETLTSALISPLHTILGGLTFTAQLLSQISSALDIIYPKRLSINDFGLNAPINEHQFVKKLTRLNINVAYLCLSQNMNTDLMKPTEALHNLAHFLSHFDKNGGLCKPVKSEILHNICMAINSEMELPKEDLDSDHEEDSFNQEESWESVVPSDMMVKMLSNGPQNVPNSPSPPPSYGAMSIVAGSFMSSWLRGITSPSNSPTSPHK